MLITQFGVNKQKRYERQRTQRIQTPFIWYVERKDTGVYMNPIYRTKKVEAAEIVLPRLKKLVSDNENYYLTDKAKKRS